MTRKIIPILLSLGVCNVGLAQQKEYADKILATVGNKIILQSDIGSQFLGEKNDKNVEIPEYAKCNMLREAIAGKIMVQQAVRDSVMVTNDQVESALDEQIRRIMYYNYGGDKAAMEKSQGKTIYQIKEEYREPIKDKLVSRKMMEEIIKNVTITPNEVETFFNQLPESEKTNIPASVEIGQIVLKPEVDPEVEAYAKQKVEDIRKQIVEEGKAFSLMAQMYSEDAGADNGGELNINRKGNLDKRFIAAAFRLQPGEISPVFRSSFGYHIVEMVERNGDDAKVKYVVVVPKATKGDYEKTIAKLDSVRTELIGSKLSFIDAVNKVSNDDNNKQQGGIIRDPNTGSSSLGVDEMSDADLALEVSNLSVGEYSKPMVFLDEIDRNTKVRILFIKSKTAPHQINLKEDYSLIQNIALQNKKMKYLNDWLLEKKSGYYIKIDPAYLSSCEMLKSLENSKQ